MRRKSALLHRSSAARCPADASPASIFQRLAGRSSIGDARLRQRFQARAWRRFARWFRPDQAMVQPVRMQPAQPAAISCLERRIDGRTRWEDRARRRPQCQESAPLQPHWSAADTIPAGSYANLNQNGVGTDGPGRKPLRMRRESGAARRSTIIRPQILLRAAYPVAIVHWPPECQAQSGGRNDQILGENGRAQGGQYYGAAGIQNGSSEVRRARAPGFLELRDRVTQPLKTTATHSQDALRPSLRERLPPSTPGCVQWQSTFRRAHFVERCASSSN